MGYFHKDVDNFIGTSSVIEETFGLPHPALGLLGDEARAATGSSDGGALYSWILENRADAPGVDAANGVITGVEGRDPAAPFNLTIPINIEQATMKGWEVVSQHNFGDSGFGVIANATIVDADVGYDNFSLAQQFVLTGLSFDLPDNLACVVAGIRRFTLLPPDQIGNLYVGPLDPTPSGQAISLVDFNDPDLPRHPRFAEALKQARSAVLHPGDAIRIPSMWWHHIESLACFNLLINYWWCTTPAAMGSPTDALMHAILSLQDLPQRQREAWRGLFNHYVFDADEEVYAHIPERGRGCLST